MRIGGLTTADRLYANGITEIQAAPNDHLQRRQSKLTEKTE